MRWLNRVWSLFRRLVHRGRDERELDAEVRGYAEMLADEKTGKGASEPDARRAARVEMGGIEQVKEEVRGARAGVWLETVWQDARYGLRMMRRNPGFAATAILTLALGIGATTAIFSVIDAVVLKPLPFSNADRLVRIKSVTTATGQGNGIASYPDFVDWRERSHAFDGMAVFRTQDFTLIGPREPQHLEGAVVSAQLFSLLRVTPALGRNFFQEEDNPSSTNGAEPVILSYGLWQREFGSDASALGRSIQLGDQPFTVVGVMPQSFRFPFQAEGIELWTTIAVDARGGANAMTAERGAHYLDVLGLLKEGVTPQQAQAELITITSSLNKEHPEVKARTARVVPEVQAIFGPLRTPLFVLLAAVGCVLLIACTNVANLFLARAASRQKEMAVRASLGASRRRVTSQLLTESMTLGLVAGGLGLALGLDSVSLLLRLLPAEAPRLNAVGLDARLLCFTFLISLLAGVFFGLAPALQVSRIDLTESLKEGGRDSGSDGKGHGRLRNALVVSEVALAAVLLPVAILLIQSFLHLTRVNPGFNPHDVLTFQLDSPAGKHDSQVPEFFRQAVARVGGLPGVSSTSAAATLPLTGDNMRCSVEIEGQPTLIGSRPSIDFNAVEPNYFRTLGVALVAGRDFTERDDSKSVPVVIVNRTLARRFFPDQDPIGKQIRPGIGNGYGPGEPPMREIVGVIDDAKEDSLDAEAAPEAYAPLAQSPFGTTFILARTAVDPRGLIEAARSLVASLDKQAVLYHPETLEEYFGQSVALPGFVTFLVAVFTGLALLLACIGIYGVMSYIVAQRTHEIGVRIALGAESGEILGWVLGRGVLLALLGVSIGLTASFGLSHLVSSLLFGVSPTDPVTFVLAPLVLVGVATLASYIPARRATRVDPMVALRYE